MLSVKRQTFDDFELIVVDDGSTDATPDLVAGFDDPRLCYIRHEENHGVSAARNAGLAMSRGRFIAFIDSDDEWLPEKLEREVRAIDAEPEETGVVYSSFWLIKDGQRRIVPSPITRWVSHLPSRVRRLEGDLSVSLQQGNFIALHAALIRRVCFERVGGFDEQFRSLEDWDLWLRIADQFDFRFVSIPSSYKYYTADSLSTDQEIDVSAAKLMLSKYGSGRSWAELRAHLLFRQGDYWCKTGKLEEGRPLLVRAFKTRPFNAVYAMAFFASCLGQRVYSSYVRIRTRLLSS